MKNCLLSCALVALGISATANPLPDPGFESGKEGAWVIGDADSSFRDSAAHSGKFGLWVAKGGSSVQSSRIAVTPGQKFTLSCWARAEKANGGAYLWYENAEGKLFQPKPESLNLKAGGVWQHLSKEFTVPAEAVTVRIWVHSWSSADAPSAWDDFEITGLPADVKVTPPPAVRKPKVEPAVDPKDIPRVENPPVIILKFDDVKPMKNGAIHARWTRIAEYLEQNGIHGSFGIICDGFANGGCEAAKKWISERRAKGCVSFWLHGWDHATWTAPDGKKYNEMVHRTEEEAFARFAKSQELAEKEFGFKFRAYGPAGGIYGPSVDAEAMKALKREKDLKIIFYPQPADKVSKLYDGDPDLLVLDRVWAVNMESSVGVADYQKFLNGYAKNLDRKFFFLQSHPAAWDDNRFAQFVKVIEFLKDRGTKFMTPEEYYDSVYGK